MSTPTPEVPSVGRIVQFVSAVKKPEEGEAAVVNLPAIITSVHEAALNTRGSARTAKKLADVPPVVSLAVFTRTKTTFPQNVQYDEAGTAAGTWHWPAPAGPGA